MHRRTKMTIFFLVIILFILSSSYQVMAYKSRQRNVEAFSPVPAEPSRQDRPPADNDEDGGTLPYNGYGEEPENNLPPVDEPTDAPAPTGRVYLTIDDGPDTATTPEILDILDRYGIKATFFVVGTQVERYPELLREIHGRGHYVGNHTYNHKYNEIYASKDAFLKSLQKNEEIIYSIIGTRPRYIRDPGGLLSKNKNIKSHTEEQGYIVYKWNVDAYDSRTPSPGSETIVRNILQQAQKQHLWQEMIILVHETKSKKNTVKALPQIIETLQERGFEFCLPVEDNTE